MSGKGIAQILFYAPSGRARLPARALDGDVYTRAFRVPRRWRPERGFYRLMGTDPSAEQDWKGYAQDRARLQRRLLGAALRDPAAPGASVPEPGPPEGRLAAHRDEHDGQLRHEHELAVLRRRVHDVVPVADGGARRAELRVRRGRDGRARRGRARLLAPLGDELGNFWVDLYRSLVYVLLPLALVLAVILVSQGVVADVQRRGDGDTLEGAQQTIARGPAASQIAIKQLGTNGGGFFNSNSAVPFENPNGLTNFLEMLSILLIPAAQVFMFGRMIGAAARRCRCSARCWR